MPNAIPTSYTFVVSQNIIPNRTILSRIELKPEVVDAIIERHVTQITCQQRLLHVFELKENMVNLGRKLISLFCVFMYALNAEVALLLHLFSYN